MSDDEDCERDSLSPAEENVEEGSKSVLAELSEENLQEFREIFNLVDKDGGGSISAEEVCA